MRRMFIGLPLLALSCAKLPPLPTYPPLGAEQTVNSLQQQTGAITMVQSRATIVLTDAAGESVSLDGALLLEKPDRLRVRAWKLGQAVFDLTVTPEGVWQYTPRDEARGAMRVTQQVARRILEALAGPQSWERATVTLDSQTVVIVGQEDRGLTERSEYDRSTLVLKRFTVRDSTDRVRFSLHFHDHRLIGGHVWPMRIEAVSEQGVVSIRFSDVEINAGLPPTAFKPPARAERVQ